MKNALFQSLCLIFVITGCSNNIDVPENLGEKIEFKLSLGGECVQIVEHSKANSNDVTAIQVYQRSAETGSKYSPYCYGLWDDATEISLTLNRGFVYRIETTYIPNAKNFVAVNEMSGAMRQPFTLAGSNGDGRVNNEFKYSSNNYFSLIALGQSAIIEGNSYSLYLRPDRDRYYGYIDDLVADKTSSISIETKRVVFGLKYDIKNFTHGEIIVKLNNVPDIVLTPQNFATTESIITLQGNSYELGGWSKVDYSELLNYSVDWKKADGSRVQVLSRSKQEFRRKLLYTLSIDLKSTQLPGDVGITHEDPVLGNGGVIQ